MFSACGGIGVFAIRLLFELAAMRGALLMASTLSLGKLLSQSSPWSKEQEEIVIGGDETGSFGCGIFLLQFVA